MILDANVNLLEATESEFLSAGDSMAAGGRYEQVIKTRNGGGLRFCDSSCY